jgi:hypothetical protein
MSIMHLSQFLQAHLASQFLGLGLITLPAAILQIAVTAYKEQARTVTVSTGQRGVGESLCRLGIAHELEYVTADGLFSIDLAIVDRRIALEFDGPFHFTTNTLEPFGHTRLPATALQRRRSAGWGRREPELSVGRGEPPRLAPRTPGLRVRSRSVRLVCAQSLPLTPGGQRKSQAIDF